jgi:hypothetical protein
MRCKCQVDSLNNIENELTILCRCAIGSAFESRFHPALVTFPKSLIDFLGARVKSLLELELDNPCVATVQALVILSHHEIGNGKDTRGWLFSGEFELPYSQYSWFH